MTPHPQQKDRCVLTRHDVRSIKDLVFVVGGNSESSAQKVIFEILDNNMRRASHSTVASGREKVLDILDELLALNDYGDTHYIRTWINWAKNNPDKLYRELEGHRKLSSELRKRGEQR